LAGDRWEYIHPVYGNPGNGSNDYGTHSGNDNAVAPLTKTVLDVTETGKLLSIGVFIEASALTSTQQIQSRIWVTVDGGTTQVINLHTSVALGAPGFNQVELAPFRVYGDSSTPLWGGNSGDALLIPMNFEYRTSLKVEIRVESTDDWTDAEFLTIFVSAHRARLVSA
jgi:hypothetical protein